MDQEGIKCVPTFTSRGREMLSLATGKLTLPAVLLTTFDASAVKLALQLGAGAVGPKCGRI